MEQLAGTHRLARPQDAVFNLFSELVQQQRERIIGILMNRGDKLSREDAEELYDDACMLLWNRLLESDVPMERKHVIGFLIQSSKNLRNHLLRRVHIENVTFDEAGERNAYKHGKGDEDVKSLYDLPEEKGNPQHHQLEKLDRVIARLSETERQLLHYFYWKGNKLEHIAQLLGYKNAKTVKTKKAKLIKKLQLLMQQEDLRWETGYPAMLEVIPLSA